MRIPLVAGRLFSSSDTTDAARVAIVNQAWARRYANGRDPVGMRVRLTFSVNETFRDIVGVVGDVAEDNLAASAPPVMYFPLDQSSGYTGYLSYVVRTTEDPAAFFNSARTVLRNLDPQVAIIQPQTMEDLLNRSPAVFLRRYPMYLIGTFAVLALVLAMVGLYGLISYSVTQRTREIGIRMAVGAQPENILRLILRQGVVASLAGVAIGLVATLSLFWIMASLLYRISWSAWTILVALACLLTGVAMIASYLPARRAMKVDPMVALRNE